MLFVVDASGSMALNRMAAAKGAALALLDASYRSRDLVGLLAFCGTTAQVRERAADGAPAIRAVLLFMYCSPSLALR